MSIRVAVAQLEGGVDVGANLDACVGAIDGAASVGARLVVLPEFCNHISWYDDAAHCRAVALDLDGAFLATLGESAARHGTYAVVNCTVKRGPTAVTATSVLFGPSGEVLGTADKQVLIGHENDFITPAQRPAPVIETEIGRLGMYACMDGVICETPRSLALRGAQVLCNSLNSFALDEESLHVPVRAAENRVFVAAANKVGPLVPKAALAAVSAATSIPERFLHGAGGSQIVSPRGEVLARAPRDVPAVVYADIDVTAADDKRLFDGTDLFASRRPRLYAPLGGNPDAQPEVAPVATAAVTVGVAQTVDGGEAAVSDARRLVKGAASRGVRLVVLPELFCFPGGFVEIPQLAAQRAEWAVGELAAACGDACHVVTSLPVQEDGRITHCGVVIGAEGISFVQGALHPVRRHSWSTPAAFAGSVDLPWARLGVVVGDDVSYPEVFRLLAINGVEVVAVPMRAREPWEMSLAVLERSAENRMSVVAATVPTSAGTSTITQLPADFTMMTPWKEREFDGLLSCPSVVRAPLSSGLTTAQIDPRCARDKVVSHRTHLVRNRPWRLVGAITAAGAKHD